MLLCQRPEEEKPSPNATGSIFNFTQGLSFFLPHHIVYGGIWNLAVKPNANVSYLKVSFLFSDFYTDLLRCSMYPRAMYCPNGTVLYILCIFMVLLFIPV